MDSASDRAAGPSGTWQFSLGGMLILVAVAAVTVASVTELPEWLGAPLLALIVVTSAAVVVNAALSSKQYAFAFYLGAAFPLCLMLVRTSLVIPALSEGLREPEPIAQAMGGMRQLYGESYLVQRLSYRWEAVAALVCAPLVGLSCVTARWLAKRERPAETHDDQPYSRWRRAVAVLALLLVPAVVVTSVVAIRSLRLIPPDPSWDNHNGTPVVASGTAVTAADGLTRGDRVFIEQGGSWWRGRVVHVFANNTITVHYVGWDSSFDETVPLSRLQMP